ncbi:MAG: tyrosine-type recombinase/integrase [Ruminococcus flavefaciens]|nr:tyrosine-type recombinase/integrase [Ruminococcus flavefaciens]
MTDNELQKVLNAIKYIPSENERDEITQIILKAASESITLDRLKVLTTKEEKADFKENDTNGFIKFTKKEINSMPDYLKKLFTINDKIVTYRYVDGLYQARFRRDGYNIEVTSKSFDIMRQKFLDKLLAAEKAKQTTGYTLLNDFIRDWLKVKKQTVKETTYKSYVNLLTHIILPKFDHYHVNEITRKDIQDFLFELTDDGKNRTAQKLKLLLSAIFDVIVEDYGIKTPMSKIVLSHYEVKKGKAFTKAEEEVIIDFCKDNPHYAGNSALLVLLYTGMRVDELETITYDDTFICCESEKTRKGYAKVIRQIPISPMLKRVLHLIDLKQTKATNRYTIRDAMKRISPERHFHELRYSFITRAKESGCNPELVMKWVGHEFDADVKTSRVDRGYTTYSQEYILQEIKKIDYEL